MRDWVAVTGGCGYVGSHIAAEIKRTTDLQVLIIDRRAARLPHTHLHADEILDVSYASARALNALTRLRPRAVIHCAANSLVGPSMTDPRPYYENNVIDLRLLLDHLRLVQLPNVIFSSSSSVYGSCDWAVSETAVCDPLNPYGRTKLMGELMISDWCRAYGLNAISFRYFNAVGAAQGLGQEPGATHVLARIMESQLCAEPFVIHGNDWPTADGTCIRDYVHVCDIAAAHVQGLHWLQCHAGNHVYNLGSGQGWSVLQLVAAVQAVTGQQVPLQVGPRRPGDRAVTLADCTAVQRDLGWQAQKTLQDIVRDAAAWYNSITYRNLA